MTNISVGIFVGETPIQSLGDSLGLTAILPLLHQKYKTQIEVATFLPEIFTNNPHISQFQKPTRKKTTIPIEACINYDCNIIKNYLSQLDLIWDDGIKPIIYLSHTEKLWAKKNLKKFSSNKKIAVCLKSSCDSRDLRYEKILSLLSNLKDDGYTLIGVGQDHKVEDNIFDISFVNKTTLREVFSIINECDLYLGVDTGLFHVAAAFDVPQVVFFRNNGCSNNHYYNTSFIDSNIKCSNLCHNGGLRECHIPNLRCMDNFNFNEYYNIIKSLL
jgi:ADP-heptose:LPS heptosyltransferase